MRRVKSQRELDVLTRAWISRPKPSSAPMRWGFRAHPMIQAQFEFTFLRRNVALSYACIVGLGVNATTLHYETNRDAWVEGRRPAADGRHRRQHERLQRGRGIRRPVSRRYSKSRLKSTACVWKPSRRNPHGAASRYASASNPDLDPARPTRSSSSFLFRMLGLIPSASDQQMRIWFNHGISHGDSAECPRPGGAQAAAPSMVVTVEPGYLLPARRARQPAEPRKRKFVRRPCVRPSAVAKAGIGVRIEDDVLITGGQPQVLSAAVPSKLEEVEASIAQLRKALRTRPAAI